MNYRHHRHIAYGLRKKNSGPRNPEILDFLKYVKYDKTAI